MLDNASYHQDKDLIEYCKKNKVILFYNLPGYPIFNYIELFWARLKTNLRVSTLKLR